MIAILGGGAWGTALAVALASDNQKVFLWMRDAAQAREVSKRRENTRCLPGAALSSRIYISAELEELTKADMLLVAIPTQQIRSLFESFPESFIPSLSAHMPVISCAKGIERTTGFFTTQILQQYFQENPLGILSGPGFAVEIAAGLPAALTLAMPSEDQAQAYASFMALPTLRLYHTTDVRGVEIGGAVKNVMAIAAGIVCGRKLGQSALAALITRSFAEISRFGQAYGARAETLRGLSGLGDLMLTCYSDLSRNFSLGLSLTQKGEAEREFNAPVKDTGEKLTEGVYTVSILLEMARRKDVKMPIAQSVEDVLKNHVSLDSAIEALMMRPQKAEN